MDVNNNKLEITEMGILKNTEREPTSISGSECNLASPRLNPSDDLSPTCPVC